MSAEVIKIENKSEIVSFKEWINKNNPEPETEEKGINPGIDAETRWAWPIKDENDVAKCIFHLRGMVECAYRKDTWLAAWRNWLLFIIGINVGLRVSDLTALQWKHFFEPDMKTFIDTRNKKEKKTGKMKDISPNDNMKNAILNYLKETGIQPEYNDFVFLNSRTGKQITDSAVEKMIKNVTRSVGLKGNYSTHTLRKTYAWRKYMTYVNNGDPAALIKIQQDLNHATSAKTATYLGITREEKIRSSYALGEMYEKLLGEDWVNKTDFPVET